MKITSFNPLIVTNHAEEIVSLFEALGFEKKHTPSATSAAGNAYTAYRMKDANGFHVDISGVSNMERDMTIIRMNVDDLDEAYNLLTAHGFKAHEGSASLTPSSKSVLMVSPSGFAIDIVKHIK